MASLTANEIRGLMEAYNDVYSPIEEEFDIDSLSEEIFEAVAIALISQGHSAVDVLEYFANVDEEVIVEDIVALSEGTLIVESVVSEEYIEEQLQQLDEIAGLLARGAMALARPAANLVARQAPRIAQAATKLGQRASNVAWRATPASSKKLLMPAGAKSAAPALRQPNLIQRAGSAISGAVGKVKDVAKGALNKIPGGSGGRLANTLKSGAKFALGGAALEAGMRGMGALMGGSGAKTAPTAPGADNKAKFNASKALGGKTAFAAGGGAAAMRKNPNLSAADVQKAGNKALRSSAGGDLKKGAQLFKAKQQIMAGKPVNASAKPAPAPAAAPEVKATNTIASQKTQPSVKPSSTPAAAKPATGTLGKTSFERRTPTSAELKAAQAARAGGETNPERVLQAAQEAGKREKQKTDIEKLKASPSANLNLNHYEYDAFDVVLEYLIDNGHAETVTEAAYIMTEMDAETIGDIVEAKYGTKEGRKALAKKIRAGKNIGKKGPGTGFKAVEKAAEKGGAKDPGAVAAAQMWKTYG